MEIEKSPPEIAKKLWSIARVLFYMMRKSIANSKIMLDLHMLLKRGKIATKSIGNLMLHHRWSYYSALTCRSDDINASFFSPRHYEFSCNNSPVFPSYRKNHRRHHRQPEELNLMHKVFDIPHGYDAASEASPLPGFGLSPAVRQLRVTDSPFPAAEESHQVDEDAEEFIKKFYKDLKNQRRIAAALDSPSPYHVWARR